ncbi:MAG: hypothetical protein MI861_20780, partial [Pirellulales bacterium]|nr:hypothetical protein [Pirellulales bacterium]
MLFSRSPFAICSSFSVLLVALAWVSVPVRNASAQGEVPRRLDATLSEAGAAISFRHNVAPILVKNCGTCHIQQSRGDFSMASFAKLSSARGVLSSGNPRGSKLITMIESGQMPPKGKKVSSADLTTLKRWVQSGAAFDGNNRNANLTSLGSGSSAPANSNSGAGYGSGGYGSGYDGGYGDSGGSGQSQQADGPGYGNQGYQEEQMQIEEDGYGNGAGYGGDAYGNQGGYSSSGGRGRTGRGFEGDVLGMLGLDPGDSLKRLGVDSFFAPLPAATDIQAGPFLKREAEQAFASGYYPLAMELMFGH